MEHWKSNVEFNYISFSAPDVIFIDFMPSFDVKTEKCSHLSMLDLVSAILLSEDTLKP